MSASTLCEYWFGIKFKDATKLQQNAYYRFYYMKKKTGVTLTPEEAQTNLQRLSKHSVTSNQKSRIELVRCCCGCEIKTCFDGSHLNAHKIKKKHHIMMLATRNEDAETINIIDKYWPFTDEELIGDIVVRPRIYTIEELLAE